MIYVLYHDYTRGLRISAEHRVAEVRAYGPFTGAAPNEAEARATIWAEHNLITDGDHSWRLVDLAPNMI